MPLMTPDPTFYPSPAMATQSPPERFAYLSLVNPRTDGRADAIGVVDLDPDSSGYGRLVGQTDMPHAGDELHHFGWNACSSCLCPYAPHPHMERRYLVVPGIQLLAHSHSRHRSPIRGSHGSSKSSSRRRWRSAPVTRRRTPCTADRTASS